MLFIPSLKRPLETAHIQMEWATLYILLQGNVNTPAFCNNTVQRDLDHLDNMKNIALILIYYQYHIDPLG